MSDKSKIKCAVSFANKQPLKSDIDNFIYKWNAAYPIDRWWRERHKIAFNSPEHRVVSFLDIYIEWREEQLYNREQEHSYRNSQYKKGDWLVEHTESISIEEEIKAFEEMDLSSFDDKDIKKNNNAKR